MSSSSDDLRLKASQSGYEQRVEVNQRMLIDKMLARYSSDFVVCRELIQNSDDAQATFFHFEITCDVPIVASNVQHTIHKQPDISDLMEVNRVFSTKTKISPERQESTPKKKSSLSSDITPNFHNSTIIEIRSVNNGSVFTQTDWKRVASIAEGNTNVDSVGQFGVGFFSVFSFSEEPIITSGNEYMTFVWRDDNSLTTFRHELPIEQQSKLTSVILKMRTKYVLNTESNLNIDEITNEHTDSNKCNVKSATKTENKISMKESIPTIDLTKLKVYFTKGMLLFTKYIKELVIKINGFTVFQIHKTTAVIPSIPDILPFQKQYSINKMLLLNSLVQTEQTFTIADGSSMSFNYITVDAQVTIDEEFHNHIRRIIKKSLPSSVQIQLLFASNSLIASQQAQVSSIDSDIYTNILNTLIPLKVENDNIIPSGHIFIGLGTHQTTGIGMHIYSHLIPTIERENIDLQDTYIAKWNKEILASAGQITRLIYDQEMLINSKKSQEIAYTYPLIIAPYSFQPSVPNNEIGQTIVDGFFVSGTDILVPVQTKPSENIISVVPSTRAFVTDSKQIHGFLSLPLVPFQLKTNGLIATLLRRQLIDYVDKSMIEKKLLTSILSIPEFIELVHWLFGNDVVDKAYVKSVLSSVRFHDHNHSSVIPFKEIKYYDVLNIPLLLPSPFNTLPRDISSILSQKQLEKQLCLSPLKLKYILDFYLDNKCLQQLSISETYPCFLSFISTHSGQLEQDEWTKVITVLSKTQCIPTIQGMKVPRESFVLSPLVSPQLPCIVLNIPQSITNNNDTEDKQISENFENPVSIDFLKKIGCRMFNFNSFDDDSSVSSSSETMKTLIKKFIKERNNMSQADFNELKEKPSLKGTTLVPRKETTRKYIPRELHFPSVAIRLQWSTLPIIDWLDINPNSSEYAFLKEIGVQEVPNLEKLITQIIQEHNVEKRKQNSNGKYQIPLALHFFAEKFQQYYFSSWKMETIGKCRFLPSYLPGKTIDENINGDVILSAPDEVFKFVNPLCPSLLPEVINLFQKYLSISSLSIRDHPTLSKAFDILMEKKTNFLTKQSAPHIFAYLNGLEGLNGAFIKKVSKHNFIPLQDLSNSNILIKPSQVFIDPDITSRKGTTNEINDKNTSGLIDYVDFGVDANAFLHNIGVANHPTPSILAELMIDRQANYFTSAAGNKDMLNNKIGVYINCLKELTVAAICSNELQKEPLYTRLKTSPWCLGFRMIDHKNGTRELIPEIVKPHEIYLDDHSIYSEKFRPLLPPNVPELSKLYERFGARWLSDSIKQTRTRTGKPVTSVRANELRDLIQYRFPMLFVNNRGESLPYCIEEHIKLLRTTLSVHEVDNIKCSLVFNKKTIELDSESASSCILEYNKNNVTLYLRKDILQIDYHDIAVELVAFCFKKGVNYLHDINEKLESSIEILRRRGIPVDRLLQNTQQEGDHCDATTTTTAGAATTTTEAATATTTTTTTGAAATKTTKTTTTGAAATTTAGATATTTIPPEIHVFSEPTQEDHEHFYYCLPLTEQFNLILLVFSFWPFRQKPKNNTVSPLVDDREPKAGPTTGVQNHGEVTDQNHQIPPVIGIGGDYTTHSHSFHKPAPMPDFGHVEKENQNDMNKIYKTQAYNHSQLIQLEHTKKQISTVCKQIPAENMTRFNKVFHSIPLYVEQNVIVTDTMADQGYQLAYLLSGLATHVFKISKETIHLFRDINGVKIAFNYGGALFFNLRYFEQVYADELKPYLRTTSSSTPIIHEVVNFYFMVICHELAHNIVNAHDSHFVSWLEKIAIKFMTEKDLFLEQFSFQNYERQM
ncbi:unnamed protein product [Adineta steineri]|uniref:Sacsin/Nov domain-containing protein n=1 Tax=Adineta steineri TaxID=433720 RepID=A0A819DKV4_9BILA|nr:unnamed protein product [Adineta steineri]CAF3837250.1 unnamed protein product [Adineta steineri]